MPAFKRLKLLKPSRSLAAAASTKPLAVSLCCSRVAACPLPAHSALLLGHSSVPFASLHTLKTLKTLHSRVAACPLPAHSPLLLGCSSLPFASLQTLKLLQPAKSLAAASTKPSGRQPLLFQHWRALCLHITLCCYGVQACRLPAFKPLKPSIPGLQLALCLHIALCCSGAQACRLPAFKLLKPLKPSIPGLQPALCLHIALCCWGIQACRLPAFKRLKLKILPIPRGSCHQVLWPSAFAVPALQPALCVYIAFSKPSNCSNLQTPSRQLPPSTLYLDVMYGIAWVPKALLGIHCQLSIFAIYSNFLYLCVCFRSGFMHKETN